MAFRAAQISVGTSSTQVVDAVAGDLEAWIQVATATGSNAIFLGPDSSVTSGNGFRLEAGDERLHVRLRPGDELWATTASSSYPVHVLVRSA